VWATLTVTLISDADGQPRYAVGLVEDITERRQAREALVRSEKLTATGRLAASLAHEISNPLQSVLGCLGLAQEMIEGEANIARYIDIGMEELERAGRIVNRLREVGRQTDDASREPTNLGELLDRIALLTRKQCQNQGIAFELSFPADLPHVEAIPDHLQQVFLNLVLNAIDAMPEGGEIHVCAHATEDPLGVEITVHDTGDGIDPGTLAEIFEPFVTTKSDGTGLGLYISRRIIEGHGGHISIESTVGEGTRVRTWLPT
jgi:signal transduction histidine kinase